MPAPEDQKITILELRDNFIRFEIKNITEGMANALRRTLINDVPKLAIDKVVFRHGQIRDTMGNVFDSSLPLFDEMVSHRIGLIPIKTDSKMNFRNECSCEGKGCSLCTVSFSIDKTGPGEVYSGDLMSFTGNAELKPVDPLIPIVKLGPNQALLVTAEATMGVGKEHAKWQVTSGVSYKFHRDFEINKSENETWEGVKAECKRSVVKETKDTITFTDDFQERKVMNFINISTHNAQINGTNSVKIREDNKSFIFKFETDGSLSAKETLKVALDKLPQRLNVLHESIVSPD
jgi:DNA-directed RNA polymerase subunit D